MCLLELWFSQGICQVVGLLGHMVVLFLVFKGLSTLFSIVAVSIYIPTKSARMIPFVHILSSIYCLQIFGDGHSDQCEVIPHCSFDLHFFNKEQFDPLFMCWPLVSLLWRNVCLGLFPYFDWIICFSGIELYELLVYFGN